MGITIRNGNFRADVYHNGKRMRKTFDNQVDAEAWLGVARQALKNGSLYHYLIVGQQLLNTFKTFAQRTDLHWKDKSSSKEKMIDNIVEFFGKKFL